MRIVFMGTPHFAVPHLRALAASNHDIVAVVTRPDRQAGRGRKVTVPPVKEAALELGLPVLQPEKLSDATFRARLTEIKPDIVCLVAYGGFLPNWLLALPPHECINVHPSLLPKYRGAAPIQRSVINGDHETGVSTMYMVEAMDAGDVILQERVPIQATDDSGTLHDRLAEIGSGLLLQTVDLIAAGKAPRTPQDESLVTLAPKIEAEDELIDWYQDAAAIDARVRGLKPRPGAYTFYGGRRVKIWHTKVLLDRPPGDTAPGTVVKVSDDAITVATASGMLQLLEVQPENARRLGPGAFANGYRLSVGDRFAADPSEVER